MISENGLGRVSTYSHWTAALFKLKLHAKSDRALYKVWHIAANTVSYHDS